MIQRDDVNQESDKVDVNDIALALGQRDLEIMRLTKMVERLSNKQNGYDNSEKQLGDT